MKANKMSIIIIGDGAVGKTSILKCFDKRPVPVSHIKTTGIDFIMHKTQLDGAPLEVKFWDTAGQENFKTMTYSFYAKADGIIVAFDVSSETSFNNCNGWIQSILKHKGPGICKILVGNKADLINLQEKCVQDDRA